MFIRELAAGLPDPTPVVACTVNPGFVAPDYFETPKRNGTPDYFPQS